MPGNIPSNNDRKGRKKFNSYKKEDSSTDPFRGPRIPPQDIESEKALIGSLLLSSEALFEITDIITHESFYAAKHKLIYQVIEDLVNKKEPVDLLTVSARLREMKELEQVGGSA